MSSTGTTVLAGPPSVIAQASLESEAFRIAALSPRSRRGEYQADREPGELYLHLHEITAEDVAAIMRRQREALAE